MKILRYKKTTKGRYKITFDEADEITLYEDVIINNNLLLKTDIDLKLLEKVLEENKKYEAYDNSLSYIEYKLRTEKEIREYLEKQGFSMTLVSQTIDRLKEENLLNDERYIEAFTNDKINLTLWGPYKIKKNLINLGIDENSVNDYVDKIFNELWIERLNKVISKRINLMKNKSLNAIKDKLRVDLYDLGYDSDDIAYALSTLEKDDTEAMKKEMSKAYDKLSKKYEGEALKYQIKNHLYKKGYKIDYIDLDIYE